jgi:sugar phosphate isomerase/epimerase
MEVAAHTYAYRDRPLDEALDELAHLGFRRVEVWLGHAAGRPAEVAQALHQRGLEAAAVSAGGFYESGGASPDDAFTLAAAIGARRIVSCVAPSRLPAIARALPPGLMLCVENHWDQATATPRDLHQAIEGLDRVGACLDTGHALLAGIRPERFAHSIGARLAHVHLKEGRLPTMRERLLGRRLRRRLLAKPEPVSPGRGSLDLARFAAQLQAVGYTGTLTLEHEGSNPSEALAQLERDWTKAREAQL